MGVKMKKSKKIMLITSVAMTFSIFAFGATRSRYFSPNNDGVNDYFEVPFSISDDGRIVAWKMVITNSRGTIVRTIGNKVSLPSSFSAKDIVKQIGKRKEGVIIPESVSWDGMMDDGTIAPDGEYSFYISATDEDGNEMNSQKYQFILDNTKPSCKINIPDDEDLIFGEGKKSVFTIKQSGSKEKQWIGEITNRDGKVVKTYSWAKSSPNNITWDGTDDKGMIVPDGVYNYSLKGEDNAGNVNDEIGIKNIIFSAEKPVTNIAINGTKYFSISEKSDITKIVLDVDIPVPTSSNKLVDWQVLIFNQNKQVVRTYKPTSSSNVVPIKKIEFDAIDDFGKQIPEGEYYAQVSAKYLNGYETVPINTSVFVFDKTSPVASVNAENLIFSPDGDGRLDIVKFKLTTDKKGGSPISNWQAKIVNVKNPDLSVQNYDFGSFCPESLTWNGLDQNGKLAADGEYELVLFASDMAGNSVTTKTPQRFILDTSKTEVMLAVDNLIFSPNADGIQDSIVFSPIVKENVNIEKYTFEIKDATGKIVYSISANGSVPRNIKWNGEDSTKKIVADGKYTANLLIESINGSQAKVEVPEVTVDTVAPYVELSTDYTLFSPDGDGNKDEIVIKTAKCSQEDLWKIEVVDSKGKTVYSQDFNKYLGTSPNSLFNWNGSDNNGNKISDGTYRIIISSQDKAGNKFLKTFENVILDTRATKVFVTTKYEGISPLSETGLKSQKFNVTLSVDDGIKNWTFDVLDSFGKSIYSISKKQNNSSVPKEIEWNGISNQTNSIAEGIFSGRLFVEYEKGNQITETSSSFICSGTVPKLTVSTTPEFFSPDNDGTDDDLFIKLGAECSGKIATWSFVIYNPEESGKSEKPFWEINGKSKITEQLTWNGLSNISKEKNGKAERVQSAMDYPWEFTVTDSLGLTSKKQGKISIDILVTREGDVLKMAVPAIIFRANAADFKTANEVAGSKVTPEQAQNNERVLKRVADILKKFPDYTITVVGHANNITGTEEEEISTANGNIPLIPLSLSRAEFVKSKLNAYGIEENRMTTDGKGGRERIAALNDRENWWKNRRVEFLLHK